MTQFVKLDQNQSPAASLNIDVPVPQPSTDFTRCGFSLRRYLPFVTPYEAVLENTPLSVGTFGTDFPRRVRSLAKMQPGTIGAGVHRTFFHAPVLITNQCSLYTSNGYIVLKKGPK